ncbi:MAG TPA: CPXCG motif-containing cysteine-rich protein [Steroidobacteraceae bacterium]|nr:CPXCG motif-containing cysteine-rich protein [Steroidobacteraceae bacterium]
MRHTKQGPRPGTEPAATDAAAVDARYGLEPVFEPSAPGGSDSASGSCFRAVQCPYCGEGFETLVDLSAGSADYIEDCQVCCRPIQFHLKVDHEGKLIRFTAAQGD